MAAIRDTRADCCLYFLPPHRLRQASEGAEPLMQCCGFGGALVLQASLARALQASRLPTHACPSWLSSLPALPPHPQIDLAFMRELAGLVPVVPVLAKADTMTGEELKVGGGMAGCLVLPGVALICRRPALNSPLPTTPACLPPSPQTPPAGVPPPRAQGAAGGGRGQPVQPGRAGGRGRAPRAALCRGMLQQHGPGGGAVSDWIQAAE